MPEFLRAEEGGREVLFQTDQLESLKNNRGLERSILVSKDLLYQAESALRQGEGDQAITLGKRAVEISPDSPAPYFFLSKAYWSTDKTDVSNVVSQYLTGLRFMPQDFWSLFNVVETIILLVFLSFFLCIATFILYSAYAYGALWIHQISESTKGVLHPVSAGFVFVTILALPLLLGIPLMWFVLFSFLIFWRFYQRSEKWTVALFLIGLGAASWLIPLTMTFIAAKSDVLMNEMVRNHQSDYFFLSPSFDRNHIDWKGLALLASYEAQGKNFEEAMDLYKKALKSNPKSPMILNNIGNLHFYQKEYEEAIRYYEQAIQHSPSLVSAYYNISQTHREMLAFKMGERSFKDAINIDKRAVEKFSQRTMRYPAFPVIEVRFSARDLWKKVSEGLNFNHREAEVIWKGWAGNIPIQYSPVISVIWFLLLTLSFGIMKKVGSVHPCASCHKSICRRCQEKIFSYYVCKGCGYQFKSVKKKSDFVIIEKAVKKIPGKFYPFFLIPGGGHLSIRKSGRGVFFLSLFFVLTGHLFLSDSFFPSTPWRVNGFKMIWVPLLLICLYLVSLFDLKRAWSKRLWP